MTPEQIATRNAGAHAADLAYAETADDYPAEAARQAYQRAAQEAAATNTPISKILRVAEYHARERSDAAGAVFNEAEARYLQTRSDADRDAYLQAEQINAAAWVTYEAEHYARAAAQETEREYQEAAQ